MFKHVYPPWHKTAQRILFVIAALLCIVLPVLYGRYRLISGQALGAVLGVYFGLWLVFALVVRFLVPSPRVESSLPIYTHVPIPTPAVLRTPARADAVPLAPAIRLHQASTESLDSPGGGAAQIKKGARFSDTDDVKTDRSAFHQLDHELDNNHGGTGDAGLTAPDLQKNVVSFQTRPRGNTTDSTNSLAYPTYAAYRQAQHGSFDAFAQRIKRAFALSQQQQQQQMQLELELERQAAEAAAAAAAAEAEAINNGSEAKGQQNQLLRPTIPRSVSSSGVSTTKTTGAPNGTRSRSSSAASMIGDFAERIRTGTLFRKQSNNNLSERAQQGSVTTMAAAVTGAAATDVSAEPEAGIRIDVEPSAGTRPTYPTIVVSDDSEVRSTTPGPAGR